MADNVLPFGAKPTKEAPPKHTYEFSLREPEETRQAYGNLSYGQMFIAVVEDEWTPVLSLPYHRINSITVVDGKFGET